MEIVNSSVELKLDRYNQRCACCPTSRITMRMNHHNKDICM